MSGPRAKPVAPAEAPIEIRRAITQAELDAVYAELESIPSGGSEVATAKPAKIPSEGAKIGLTKGDSVGIHMTKDRTNVVFMSRKRTVDSHVTLNVGYGEHDQLLVELSRILTPIKKKKVPVYMSMTGAMSPSFIVNMARLPRQTMLKALKVQFKQVLGEDRDEIHYTSVAGKKHSTEGQSPVLAAALDKSFAEKTQKAFKKLKIRLTGWDTDLLCYGRAVGYLWQRLKIGDSTRFMVILDWDHCRLFIESPDGKIVAPKLPVGIQSFLQHLMQSRDNFVPKSLDEKHWRVLPSDAVEIRQRKMLAQQAIHEVYTPLAQQLKTQLYAACNEQGIPLPTHFVVVAPGSTNLFQIAESLALDLSLKAVPLDHYFPAEAMAAVGTAIWEKSSSALNMLPKAKRSLFGPLAEIIAAFRGKVSLAQILQSLPLTPNTVLGIPAVIIGLLSIVPLYQRYSVSRKYEARQVELKSLEGEKKRIADCKRREEIFDKKSALIAAIERKRFPMSSALKELFSLVPKNIRLNGITLKGDILNIKGIAPEHTAVQKLLREALGMKHLTDPIPVELKREKNGTKFEVTMRFTGV